MSGQYSEIADLKRRLYEIERRIGVAPAAGPQPAELGEVTDDSPFVVTLTDGMEISPSTTFGGTAVVGDPALVLYPRDGDPVALLKAAASASSFGAEHFGPTTYTGSFNIDGSGVPMEIGQSVAWLLVVELSEDVGGTATGDVDGDSGGSSGTYTGSFDTRAKFDLGPFGRTTVVVTFGRTGCTSPGSAAPQADVSLTGTVVAEATFFWMVF